MALEAVPTAALARPRAGGLVLRDRDYAAPCRFVMWPDMHVLTSSTYFNMYIIH